MANKKKNAFAAMVKQVRKPNKGKKRKRYRVATAKAIAASIGRKKYGKKAFAKMALLGKKRAAKKRKGGK